MHNVLIICIKINQVLTHFYLDKSKIKFLKFIKLPSMYYIQGVTDLFDCQSKFCRIRTFWFFDYRSTFEEESKF